MAEAITQQETREISRAERLLETITTDCFHARAEADRENFRTAESFLEGAERLGEKKESKEGPYASIIPIYLEVNRGYIEAKKGESQR